MSDAPTAQSISAIVRPQLNGLTWREWLKTSAGREWNRQYKHSWYMKHHAVCIRRARARHRERSSAGVKRKHPLWPPFAIPLFRLPAPCNRPGCDREAKVRGYCGRDYARARLGIPMNAPNRMPAVGRTCSVGGCDLSCRAHGLCHRHYQQRRVALAAKCATPQCDNHGGYAGGLCSKCYSRVRRGRQSLDAPPPVRRGPNCERAGCLAAHYSRGLCWHHYKAIYPAKTCNTSGCGKSVQPGAARGLCHACYSRVRLRGRQCTWRECARELHRRGLCLLHYNRKHKNIPMDAYIPGTGKCAVAGCEAKRARSARSESGGQVGRRRPSLSTGFCSRHYYQAYKEEKCRLSREYIERKQNRARSLALATAGLINRHSKGGTKTK